MANNRMYMTCPVCGDDQALFLAKYYPSEGWYVNDDYNLTKSLNKFMDTHKACSDEQGTMIGPTDFKIKYEMVGNEGNDIAGYLKEALK